MSFLFVCWQLRQREIAADIVIACTELISQQIESPDFKPDTQAEKYKELHFPKSLVDQINKVSNSRRCLEGPRKSEAITYIAIIVWAILATISISY